MKFTDTVHSSSPLSDRVSLEWTSSYERLASQAWEPTAAHSQLKPSLPAKKRFSDSTSPNKPSSKRDMTESQENQLDDEEDDVPLKSASKAKSHTPLGRRNTRSNTVIPDSQGSVDNSSQATKRRKDTVKGKGKGPGDNEDYEPGSRAKAKSMNTRNNTTGASKLKTRTSKQ